MTRSPAAAYIAPFAAFIVLLALRPILGLPDLADQLLMISVVGLVIVSVSRRVLDFRVRHWIMTVAAGILVFVLWIAPDVLIPGYRHFILFDNPWLGKIASSLSNEGRDSTPVLALRVIRAVVIVPIAEELFWRGWLTRWLITHDFQSIPLGSYTAASFWIVAVLFATEHGPYWDVGLAAGVIFNGLMVRTRSLGDLILAHAIANACLCAYVLATGKWEYWL